MTCRHALRRRNLTFGFGLALTGVTAFALAQDTVPAPVPPFAFPAAPAAQPVQTAPQRTEPTRIGPDGKPHPLPEGYMTAINPLQFANPPAPQEGKVMNADAVKQGQPFVPQFGSKGETPGIAYRGGFFLPPQNERVQPALVRTAQARTRQRDAIAGSPAPSVYALLLLDENLTDALASQLTNAGVELLGHYPINAVRVRIPADALQAVAALPGVRWIGQPTRAQKFAPEMQAAVAQRAALLTAVQTVPVFVHLFGPDANGEQQAALQALGATLHVVDTGLNLMQVEIPLASLDAAANLDAVLYIEPVPEMHPLDAQSMSSINADMLWGSYFPANNNAATQVKMGIVDTGSYVYHTDFSGIFGGSTGYNFISGENWYDDLQGHGTFCSGLVMGEGRGNAMYRGVASGLVSHGDPNNNPDWLVAQVFDKNKNTQNSSDYKGLQAMNGEFNAALKRQVFNASFGGFALNLTGTDAYCIKVDQMFQNNVLAVVAAGNNGYSASGGTINTPGVAKGALTVGAVVDDDVFGATTDTMASYSSRGATGDGRVKPDVVAPGSYIDSTRTQTGSGYSYNGTGTSFAAPHVTGIAASLMGHYNLNAWQTKAAIIAGAIDLGLGSTNQGRGKVDAMTANYAIDGGWKQIFGNTIGGTGSVQYADFSLGHAVANLRIVLTYPDTPPAGGASVAIVNDLDLGLQVGGLTTDWSGSYFSSSSRDTVEVINVPNAAAGNYRIKVHSYRVTGSQAWAVAWATTDTPPAANVTTTLNVPYAVSTNTSFLVDAYAANHSYVATGVAGEIYPPSGFTINTLYAYRNGPSGTEYFAFANPDSGAAGHYIPSHMDMGNIANGYSRHLAWSLKTGSAEGYQPVTFYAFPSNGNNAHSSANVLVDGTAPVFGTAVINHWSEGLQADVTLPVSDALSGLAVSTAYYRASKDGGNTWFVNWTHTSSTGSNKTTAAQTITAPGIAFGQNDATNNLVQFYIEDMAGNYVYSPMISAATGTLTDFALAVHTIAAPDGLSATVTLSDPAPAGGAVVALTTDNATAVGIPATVTIPEGTTSVAFALTTSDPGMDTTVNLTAAYGGATVSQTLLVRTAVNCDGVVTLDSIVDAAQSITFAFIPTDGSATVTMTQTLAANGAYHLTGVPAKTYTLRVKGAKWLAETVSVDATAGDVTGADVFLPGGDANDDNVVDIADFGTLVNAYNGIKGVSGSNYDAAADFNCDGFCDIADFGILVNNYNRSGAP